MRSKAPRVAALFAMFLMVSPLPLQLLGEPRTAAAQADDPLAGLLPGGVSWNNWPLTHKLYASLPATVQGGTCPADPATNLPTQPGDLPCQIPLNTTEPTGTVIDVTASRQATFQGGQIPLANQVFLRLEPAVSEPLHVSRMSVKFFATFGIPLTTCAVNPTTGQVSASVQVRALPSGDEGTDPEAGVVIGQGETDNVCPAGFGLTPTTPGPWYELDVDVPLSSDVASGQAGVLLGALQKLRVDIGVGMNEAGQTWELAYNAQATETQLAVSSDDAYQYALWTTDAIDKTKFSTIFPIPNDAATRLSAIGWFGFKDSWGGYDNPDVNNSPPQPTDAKWSARIIAPDGTPVMLRDPAVNPNKGEFNACGVKDNTTSSTDIDTCLRQAQASLDTPPSAKVFRMEDRPHVPGTSDIWNYTRDRLAQIAPCPGNAQVPCGGEFKLRITGQVHGNSISSVVPDGLRFTVGGHGLLMTAFRLGDLAEQVQADGSVVHTVVPGQGTTFLLNVTNLASTADNFTLSATFRSPSDPTGWSAAFGGRPVIGGNTLLLQGLNSSVLKVTVTPPGGAGSGSSVVRVRATSVASPDQFVERDLITQVSTTLVHGTGLFVFPESGSKVIHRGGHALFNVTVWNRGSEPDAYNVKCVGGPTMTVDPATLLRTDDSWNGTLGYNGTAIGCVDANATRQLTVALPPGDTADVQVVLESNFNNVGNDLERAQVRAESQKESTKTAQASVEARLELRSSFKMLILTDGLANPSDPLSAVSATRTLRLGKDDYNLCPNPVNQGPPGTTNSCGTSPDTEGTLTGDYTFHPVIEQRIDINFSEYAFYRVQLVNDGDVKAGITLNIGKIKNESLEGQSGCPAGPGLDTFTEASKVTNGVGMNDPRGVVLLRSPTISASPSEEDVITTDPDHRVPIAVDAGQTSVVWLRVHNEWNRYNLSVIGAGGSLAVQDGPTCDSRSTVEIQASSNAAPFPKATVTAVTYARNVATTDKENLPSNMVITDGSADGTLFTSDTPQPCPPAASDGVPVLCRYVEPGQTTNWTFTATKFTPTQDSFDVGPVLGSGGQSLADLRNRGWVIPDHPTVKFVNPLPGFEGLYYASGDEITVTVPVTVPRNATISDFAGLQVAVCSKLQSCANAVPITFFTVGAQQFRLSVTPLIKDTIFVHNGDRAAINLNVSNEGAAVDIYNITIPTVLPSDWAATFQPNETRVSPSHNKTVTVFLQTPLVGQFPQTVSGTIRVQSQVNLTRVAGRTFVDVPFQVNVRLRGQDDLLLTVNGTESKPVDSGGSVTFTLNLTNPSPNQLNVKLRRIPENLAQFVDGWSDVLGEGPNCVLVDGHGGSKLVQYTITAAADALEGTHVTYVLRADQADAACNVPAPKDGTNFAQALVTATVIGKVGLDVQPLEPVKVVQRGGSTLFPIRVRNIGTAGDTFFFTPTFVNQSQPLPPNAWSVQVETNPSATQCPQQGPVVQSLLVDPQTSCIVFVNVSAPINVPQTGVRSDIDFGVHGTQGSPQVVRLTAFLQDYSIAIRLPNATVDAIPGETKFFTLNLTNTGNGIDDFQLEVSAGSLSSYWNISTELDNVVVPCGHCITLLNGTSRNIQMAVQVPRSPLPTVGAVIGVTVRSVRAQALLPVATENFGAGSPIVALLQNVPKPATMQVNLYPYVQLDVDGDREPELAVDRNKNPADGFEYFFDPFTGIIQSIDVLAADGTGDGKIDHFIDINGDGKPDRYWSPDRGVLTVINAWPDVNNDGTLEFIYDSTGSLAADRWIDPLTHQSGTVVQKDFDDDGSPEYLIDTNGDGRPDKYFDPDRGPRGLVTNVLPGPGGNLELFALDTNGAGQPTKLYNRVTGEVSDYRISGILEFVASYWYMVLMFAAVAVLAAYLAVQRRREGRPPEGGEGR